MKEKQGLHNKGEKNWFEILDTAYLLWTSIPHFTMNIIARIDWNIYVGTLSI